MTESEFVAECIRLYTGWKRDVDLTPQKLAALASRYQHLEPQPWHDAVDLALLDSHLPNAERFDTLVGRAEERFHARVTAARDADARRMANGAGVLGIVHEAARRSDSDAARAAIANIQRIIANAPPTPPFDHEAVGQTPWRKMAPGVRRA